jgi:hypothetical protein
MSRKVYESAAEKQRAYRDRIRAASPDRDPAAELLALRNALRRLCREVKHRRYAISRDRYGKPKTLDKIKVQDLIDLLDWIDKEQFRLSMGWEPDTITPQG